MTNLDANPSTAIYARQLLDEYLLDPASMRAPPPTILADLGMTSPNQA